MLLDLHVRNLAVLASASVEFGPGLNILTGETGAGKSIVVDSLSLLAGARASTDLIRTGEDLLTVAGVFEPPGTQWRERLGSAGVDATSDRLIVRREISREGRNRVFINDQPVTVGLLAEVAAGLLRIHSQREELALVSPELQREWLDRSGGGEAIVGETARRYERYRALASRLQRLAGDERLRLERIDLLRFQLRELEAARLVAGEEEELRSERDRLRHSEAIGDALTGAYALLFDQEGASSEQAARAENLLQRIADWEPSAAGWAAELEEVRIRIEELAEAIRERLDSVQADPARLDSVEERLAMIERLCRKHAKTSAELLLHQGEMAAELAELEGAEKRRGGLEAEVEAALSDYRQAALELSGARQRWGEQLAAGIHRELGELAMPRARFAVSLERRRRGESPLVVEGEPVEFSAEGVDQVGFQIAANPGEAMGPLARIASGGELSRVYLALQLGVRRDGAAAATTLVFDEVDAGIGGAAAAALGRKLRRLAGGGQILVVTHLPQVASHAHRHFKVIKRVSRGRTVVSVVGLDGDGRVEEIARMLAGKEVTGLSRSHAEELIAVATRGAR